jgi:hypothetical protein
MNGYFFQRASDVSQADILRGEIWGATKNFLFSSKVIMWYRAPAGKVEKPI